VADTGQRGLELGKVGHDAGRLVLRLERPLAAPSAEVRQALTASALPAERWEVDDDCPGSRLSLTAWIDADDIEQAGSGGAEYRRRFERLVRDLEPGSARRRSADVGVARLAEEYRAAFAGALADTD